MKSHFSVARAIGLWACLFLAGKASAEVKVIATSTDIAAIIKEVGGAEVEVESLAKGSQDLHALEPKPSFMSKLSRARLLVANGLALESGWLPSVVRGARNPKLNSGGDGYLELGDKLDPLESVTGKVSRAEGDVHPEGNPHWSLDPIRVGKAAILISERLSKIDPAHATAFNDRAKAFQSRLEMKTKSWSERIKKSGVKSVVTYHKTLNYFLDRFALKGAGYLEPKPGIPPTAQHILDLLKRVKAEGVSLILVEHFYDLKAAERVAAEVPGMKVKSVPAAVDGLPGIATSDDVFEALVKAVESASEVRR